MFKLLIVEDDRELAEIIKSNLQKADFITDIVHSCAQALSYIKVNSADVYLLDIMLEDGNGIDLCAEIRKHTFAPIMFISAISDEEFMLEAFKTGGDDYLTKPINFPQMVARINALLRRVTTYGAKMNNQILAFNNLVINTKLRTVEYNEKRVFLSTIEYGILLFLIENIRKTVSVGEIFEGVWTKEYNNDARTVVVHISNLRKKLEESGVTHEYIVAVRGKGYVFLPDAES